MSRLTRCNYCTLKALKKKHGEENLIIRKVGSGVPKYFPADWTEVYLKAPNGDEHFVAVFVAVTNQCVC